MELLGSKGALVCWLSSSSLVFFFSFFLSSSLPCLLYVLFLLFCYLLLSCGLYWVNGFLPLFYPNFLLAVLVYFEVLQ